MALSSLASKIEPNDPNQFSSCSGPARIADIVMALFLTICDAGDSFGANRAHIDTCLHSGRPFQRMVMGKA